MINTKMLVALTFALLGVAAPVAAQAPSAAIDPVGMYDFEATFGIEGRNGTLEIQRNAEGQLVGEAWLEGESDPATIQSGVVTGNRVELSGMVNNSLPVTFILDFTGNEFEGVIVANSDSLPLIGTKRN